jgi:hypothetical protein
VTALLVSHQIHAAHGASIAEAAAEGNDERVLLDNLGRWHRGEPLVNEVEKQ